MGKPTVGSGSMPMLHTGRYVDYRPREHLLSRLSPFLIPATSSHTDEHLSSALGGMMNVPVVAATRFEGDIGDGNLLIGNSCQITVAFEIEGENAANEWLEPVSDEAYEKVNE